MSRRTVLFVGLLSALGVAGPSASTLNEPATDLYGNPQPVTIEGYTGRAMEPFLAPDGTTLFFNTSNEPGVDTNLRVATRTGPLAFRDAGELTGANTTALDAVPSLDRNGRFYFTSLRQYDRDLKSIFAGRLKNGALENVHAVEGTFTPTTPGWINMDVSISPDGRTMYISRARFAAGIPFPKESDLMVARQDGDSFAIDSRSQELLAKVNTPALEYAPAISTDGLELYFTRASGLGAGGSQEVSVRILVAHRARPDAPFEEPYVLDALDGYVEAPSPSLDGRELFFHKKVDGRFMIYRAIRHESPK